MTDDPRRKRRAAAPSPLIDLDAPDTSTASTASSASTGLLDLDAPDPDSAGSAASAAALRAPTHGPRAEYSGGEKIRENGVPVARRGIASRIGDYLDQIAGRVQGGAALPGVSTERGDRPEETRRPAYVADRRTPTERTADSTATERGRQDRLASSTKFAQAGGFGGGMGGHVTTPDEAADFTKGADLRARFTPEQWADVAKRGMQLAAKLNTEAVAMQGQDAAAAEQHHQHAEDVSRKAYNAQLLSENAATADTEGAIALSSLLGIVHDPYAGEWRNINAIRSDPSLTFTPEEQSRDLGKNLPVSTERAPELAKDVTVPLAASLPVFVAGGVAGRAALEGIGARAAGEETWAAARAARRGGSLGEAMGPTPKLRGVARIADALAREIETKPLHGPKQTGLAGLREAAENFGENLGTLAERGAGQGQVIGAVQAAREAQQRGGDPLAAAGQAALANIPVGMLGEIGGGAFARVFGVADRSVAGSLDRVMERLDPRGVSERSWREAIGKTSPVEPEVLSSLDQGAEAVGRTPVSGKSLEGQRSDLAKALDRMLSEKQADATGFGSDVGQIERDPRYLTPREAEPEVPLRSQMDVARERAGMSPDPLEVVDANVKMQRARESERLMAEQVAQEAEQGRLEQAAIERDAANMGPKDMRETIAHAAEARDAGEPLAADYHDAISKFADVQARTQDAETAAAGEGGENAKPGKPVSAKLRLDYARARSTLNEMRKKYGAQAGGAALLGLAAHDGDLDEDEKQWLGIGGALAMTTGVVRRIPRELAERALAAIDKASDAQAPRQNWIDHFAMNDAKFGEHFTALDQGLRALEAAHGEEIPATEVRALVEKMASSPTEIAPQGPRETPFISRLARAVETLPGKAWDAPRPVGDWLGKLKGLNTFSRAELALVEPALKALQESKTKVTRADVLALVDQHAPNIERVTLAHGSASVPDDADTGASIDVDDLNPEYGETILTQQRGLREQERADLQAYIDEQTEEATNARDAAERDMSRANDAIESHLNDHFGDNDPDAAMEAIRDYLRDHVEAEYVPRGAVDTALLKAMEAGDLYQHDSEIREPRDAGDITEHEGPDGEVESVTFTVNGTDYTAPTTWEAADKAQRAGDFHWNGDSDILPDGVTIERVRGPHPSKWKIIKADGTKVEGPIGAMTPEEARAKAFERYGDQIEIQDITPSGERVVWEMRLREDRFKIATSKDGESREAFVDGFVRERFSPEHDDESALDELKDLIDRYADNLSEYNRAESEAWYMEEGDAFEEQQSKISDLDDEIARIDDLITEAQVSVIAGPARGANAEAGANAAEADPFTAPVPVKPTAAPKYATYQRIGGGREYEELLNVWSNNPGNKYTEGHWTGYPDTQGHVRMETQDVPDVPGLTGRDVVDVEDDTPLARVVRERLRGVRETLRKNEQRMGEIAREYEALPADQQHSVNAIEMANEYRRLADEGTKLAEAESDATDELARALGIERKTKPVRVLIESQSDLAQDAGRHGVQREITPEMIAAHEARVTPLREEAQRIDDEMVPIQERMHHLRLVEWHDRRLETIARLQKAGEPTMTRGPDGDTYSRVPSTLTALQPSNWIGEPEGAYEAKLAALDAIDPHFRLILDEWLQLSQRHGALDTERTRIGNALLDAHADIENARQAVPRGPYTETKVAHALNAARALANVADRGYDLFAWSDAANRTQNAHLPIAAASLTYDNVLKSAFKSILGGLGFKDVKIGHTYIRGHGHWTIDVTPEMRAAIRKFGVPALGVLAAMAVPSDAEAQDGKKHGRGSLYATALGSLAAGALLGAMFTNKKLRALANENRELSRALMRDDLSGLANKRAMARAMESVDADPTMGWIAFDGNRFKAMNDTHGHPEGDKAIAHFGKIIMQTAEKLGVPMRGFRAGGDEFAFAAPKAQIAAVMQAIEAASPYTKGDGDAAVTTSLTGGYGDTFAEADAMLNTTKDVNRRIDPSLRRTGELPIAAHQRDVSNDLAKAIALHDKRKAYEEFSIMSGAHHVAPTESGVGRASLSAHEARPMDRTKPLASLDDGFKLYANPVGPALDLLRRSPGAAGVAALGAIAASQDDNEMVRRMGLPLIGIAALHAIGSDRLWAGKDKLGTKLVERLRKTDTGLGLVRAFNPDALLSPELLAAFEQREADIAKGKAMASNRARKNRALGPEGDRAVSDVLDNEAWEGPAAQTLDVLTVAGEYAQEIEDATQAQLAAGTLEPDQVIENYGGPRKYAHHEVAYALASKSGAKGSGNPPVSPRITKTHTRTLDVPIREAERALQAAHATGDQAAIQAATEALDEAQYDSYSKRVALGEIRESSYRAAAFIEKAYTNVANAKLFTLMKNTPGVVHPEWVQAVSDYQTATSLARAAKQSGHQPDIDATKIMVGDAAAHLDDLSKRFSQKDAEYVKLPNTPAYGMLRGAIVQRDAAHAMEGWGEAGLWGKMLRGWKELHTVFNPGTHVGNITSNSVTLHMHGVSAWQQPRYYKRALTSLKTYGDGARGLTEAGAIHLNASNAEGQPMTASAMRSAEGLESLLPTTRPETAEVIRRESERNSKHAITEPAIAARAKARLKKGAAIGAVVGAAQQYDTDHPERSAVGAAIGAGLGALAASGKGDMIRKLYGHEDNLARIALYEFRRDAGDTHDVAVQKAIGAFGDFRRSRSPALHVLRNVASPFIMYQAKAVPAFAKSIVDHPYRYLTLVAAWAAINELSKREVGEIPEEDKDERDRATWGYVFPGFMQLPITDTEGNKGAIDMSRYTPLGGFATGAPPGSVPDAFSPDAPQVATPGGPLIDLGLRAANIHPLTKQPIFNRDAPTSENIGAALREATDLALPSALSYHARNIQRDYDNRDFAKMKTDVLGPLGAKPRFVREGAQQNAAKHELQRRLSDLKYQLKRDVTASHNPARDSLLTDSYFRRAEEAQRAFERRTTPKNGPAGPATPRDTVDVSQRGKPR